MAEAAAATREEEREARMMNKSPSDFSYQSYEMFVGGQAAPPDGRSSQVAGGGGSTFAPGGCCSSAAAGGGGGDCCCCCNAHNGGNGNRADEKMSLQSDDADSLTGGVHDSRVRINGCVNRKVNLQLPQPYTVDFKSIFSFSFSRV